MRQSTKRQLNARAFLLSKLPMRQSTRFDAHRHFNLISKLPMRQSTYYYFEYGSYIIF